MCRSLHKAQGDARGSKAGAKAGAQAMGQARGGWCKPARGGMGVHHGNCPRGEFGACLGSVLGGWGEQVPKQMGAPLGGK